MAVDLSRIRNLATALRERAEAKPQPRSGRSWYRIDNRDSDVAEIMIYDMIGEWGVSAQDFVNELKSLKASTVTLRVNSEGGEVFDGLAIYEAITRHPADFTAFVDGLAASAASFIVCAASKVVMAPRARMMIHDAHGFAMGNARDMRSMADLLDDLSDNIADIYAEKAGGTRASWREAMRAAVGGPDGTWYSADAAVKAGLADEVRGTDEGPGKSKDARASVEVADGPGFQALPAAANVERVSEPVTPFSAEALAGVFDKIENPRVLVPLPSADALFGALFKTS